MKVDGILVRANMAGNDLLLVLEPMDEDIVFRLASHLTKVRLASVEIDKVRMSDIERNINGSVWLTWDGETTTLESENAPTCIFQSANVATTERDYDAQELRAKFEYFGQCVKSGQESERKAIAGLTKTKRSIAKFIGSHRHTWTVKRDFFAARNSGKAKEFAVRLEVLDEIDKIMKGD